MAQPRSRHQSFSGSTASSRRSSFGAGTAAPSRPSFNTGRLAALLQPLTPISRSGSASAFPSPGLSKYAPPLGTPRSRRGSVNVSQGGQPPSSTSPAGPISASSLPRSSFSSRPRAYTAHHPSPPIAAEPRTSVGGMTPAGERVRRRSSVFAASSNASSRGGSFAHPNVKPAKPRKSFVGSFAGYEEPSQDENPEEKARDAAHSFSVVWQDLVGKLGDEGALSTQVVEVLKGIKSGYEELASVLAVTLAGLPPLQRARLLVAVDDLTAQLSRTGALLTSQRPRPPSLPALSATLEGIASDPVYQSAFLHALPPLLALINSSEPLRRSALYIALDSLGGGNESTGLTKAVQGVRDVLESLTGLGMWPVVRALAEWLVGLEAFLTRAPALIEQVLNEPLPPSAYGPPPPPGPPPGPWAAFFPPPPPPPQHRLEQVLHPLGYTYTPELASGKLQQLADRLTPLFEECLPTAHLLDTLKRVGDAVLGNARVSRVVRAAERVGRTAQSGKGWVEVVREAGRDVVHLDLNKIEGEDESYTYTFDDIHLQLSSILPAGISFDTHTFVSLAPSASLKPTSTVTLKLSSFTLRADRVAYSYSKKGMLPLSDSGKADVVAVVDASAAWSAQTGEWRGLDVQVKDVGFTFDGGESVKANVYKALWPLVGEGVRKALERGITEWVGGYIASLPSWDSLFSLPEPSSSTSAADVSATQLGLPPFPSAVASRFLAPAPAPGGPTGPAVPTVSRLPPSQHPLSARDAFRQAVGSHPSLRSDVLAKLENPLSGPPSLGGSRRGSVFGEDEGSLTKGEEGEGAGLEKIPKRRASMAEWLTKTSAQDGTLPESIENPITDRTVPPTSAGLEPDYPSMAGSLTAAARADSTSYAAIQSPIIAPEADPTSVQAALGRRGSQSAGSFGAARSFSASIGGGATLDDYPEQPGDDATRPHLPENFPSMATSLTDTTSLDATQPEHIHRPPQSEEREEDTLPRKPRALSMRQTTLSLLGMPDVKETPFFDRYRPDAVHDYAVEDEDAPEPQRPMSRSLTPAASRDETLAENMTRGGRRQSESCFVGLDQADLRKRRMSASLNEETNYDATLPDNIASPPTSRPVSRSSSRAGSRRGSRPSFTGLTQMTSMSEIGLDERTRRDSSNPDPHAKRPSPDDAKNKDKEKDEFHGLKRRPSMASYLTPEMQEDRTQADWYDY